MDEKTKNIIDGLKKQQMTVAEKDILKKRVFSYMQNNPLPTPSPYRSFASSFFGTYTHTHAMRTVFAGFLIFILTSSTLTYAAEQSLPGDPLYGVKTGVNESILRVFVATTPERAVSFETSLMEKRLVEAEMLEQKNKLTKINRDTVEQKIGEQEERVRVAFARLPQEEGVQTNVQGASAHVDTASSVPQGDQGVSTTTTLRVMSVVQPKVQSKKIQKKQDGEGSLREVNNGMQVIKKTAEILPPAVSENADEHIEIVFEKHKDIVKKMREERDREEKGKDRGDSKSGGKGKNEENN